jgi:glycosyltransferase involved in cell wall biosynthesis
VHLLIVLLSYLLGASLDRNKVTDRTNVVRILMVTDFYWPFLGGVEQHVRTLSHALQERGHQVSVASLWSEGLAEAEEDKGVSLYRLQGSTQRFNWLFSNPKRPWAPPFPDPEITLGLRRIIAREQPEIVHGHDWLSRSFLPIKPWSRAKLVVSLHYYTLSCAKKNLMFRDAPCSGPGFTKCLGCGSRHYGVAKGSASVLANWGMSAAERSAVDMFISVSQATATGNQLDRANVPQRVIPNFLPNSGKASPEVIEPYVAQLPKGEFMLFVGDLRPMKGLDVLLTAYAGLQEALPDVPPLVLIGKVWPDTPAELPPNTLVLREWPNQAVMEAWRRSTIALVPSVWSEPFGIVVIEAMAGETPVIASSIGGIPEIIVDGESGMLVPPGDARALRAAMQQLLQDTELRQKMGQAAKRRAADFEAGAVVPRIEAIYQQLLAA